MGCNPSSSDTMCCCSTELLPYSLPRSFSEEHFNRRMSSASCRLGEFASTADRRHGLSQFPDGNHFLLVLLGPDERFRRCLMSPAGEVPSVVFGERGLEVQKAAEFGVLVLCHLNQYQESWESICAKASTRPERLSRVRLVDCRCLRRTRNTVCCGCLVTSHGIQEVVILLDIIIGVYEKQVLQWKEYASPLKGRVQGCGFLEKEHASSTCDLHGHAPMHIANTCQKLATSSWYSSQPGHSDSVVAVVAVVACVRGIAAY